MIRLELHACTSWTSVCWPHRESQQPHPPPKVDCQGEQPHGFEQEAEKPLHRIQLRLLIRLPRLLTFQVLVTLAEMREEKI